MRRFFRKRLPAFLLTLVMVMTMVPAVSARSSADIEYEVDAGDNVTLELSAFKNYYSDNMSDSLERLEFTDLTGVDARRCGHRCGCQRQDVCREFRWR